MYIVRWLMGHPIIATWFLGAIAILLTIGNSDNKKESHADDHATKQEHVVSTDSTKSLETPSPVSSALIESGEKKVAVLADKVEVETISDDAIVKKEAATEDSE